MRDNILERRNMPHHMCPGERLGLVLLDYQISDLGGFIFTALDIGYKLVIVERDFVDVTHGVELVQTGGAVNASSMERLYTQGQHLTSGLGHIECVAETGDFDWSVCAFTRDLRYSTFTEIEQTDCRPIRWCSNEMGTHNGINRHQR
jgi:hypothetical protein